MTPVQFADRDWQLLPAGGLHWPRHNALFVADLHLGKDATFRSASLSVPRGSTQATLKSVSDMLVRTAAQELFILGDLFHARSSLTSETIDVFGAFLKQHESVDVTLIDGNHERGIGRLPDDWKMTRVATTMHLDGVAMRHEPGTCPPDADVLIAGHLHPGYALITGNESTGKLPCFWYSDHCLILPACGHFTGTSHVQRRVGDQLWLIADDRVLAI